MRTIVTLALAATIISATPTMAYAEPGPHRIRATLTTPGQAPQSMTYGGEGKPLLFKDEAACQHALINDQEIRDSIAMLKVMFASHETAITIIVECVPAAPSI